MKRISFVFSAFVGVLLLSSGAVEAKFDNYDDTESFQKAFEEAQSSGDQVILVDFAADWCPTCKQQAKVLKKVFQKSPYSEIKGIRVDYDQVKDLREAMNVPRQSTLILFKGDKEVARTIGATDETAMTDFLDQAF